MRSQDGDKLIFSYFNEDGTLWVTKEFQKVKSAAFAALSLKKYDDIFGAKRWAEGNGYLIIDDAPLPHPDKLKGTPPDKLKEKPAKEKKKKSSVDTVDMLGHKCMVKYCRGTYQPHKDYGKDFHLACDKCEHLTKRLCPKDEIKKIDKPKG